MLAGVGSGSSTAEDADDVPEPPKVVALSRPGDLWILGRHRLLCGDSTRAADAFFRGVFTNVLRALAPPATVYCWHAHKRQRLIAEV